MSDNKNDKLVNVQSNLLPALMKEVEGKMVVVRGQKTLLDRDVAALYGWKPSALMRRSRTTLESSVKAMFSS